MKYARKREGSWIDVFRVPEDFPDLATLNRCLPFGDFVLVPDALKSGDFTDGTASGYTARPVNPGPTPQPNIPGNQYFGKKPLKTADFWALIGTAMAADRLKRLVNDSHFIWVNKVLDTVSIVDPDDKGGQFLLIVLYLTITNGDDGALLMEKAERDAIMAAWK